MIGENSVHCDALLVKAGNTQGYVECDIKDQTGSLVARAASTCIKRGQARPTVIQ
jgi:hypothetical protein